MTTMPADHRADAVHALPHKLIPLVQPLTHELADRLPPGTPFSDIIAHIITALRELNTSVSYGALPEMASQLAEHRLRTPDPN